MMRKILLAIAGMSAAGMMASSFAQTPAPPAISAADRTLYAVVASESADGAAVDADVSWTAQHGRGGIVRYAAPDVSRCRTFFLRQFNPEVRPAVIGKVCPLGAGAYAASDIRPAAAAGPVAGSNGGGTRGITLPPSRPQPPPTPPPAPATRETPPPPAPAPTGGRTDARPVSRSVSNVTPGVTKGGQQINVKPVLVQIGRATSRYNQNGGHAVVLLQDTTHTRNLQLCEALLRHFDDAPLSDVLVGLRREADGSVSALRPIYWPVNERLQVSGSACSQRLLRYDYNRARTIRDKLAITGDGPYLVVTRSDERAAAIINLTGMSAAQIEQATRYFSASFSQRGDVWNPQQFTPRERERSLIATFGADFPRVLLAAVGFYSAAATGAGASVSGCRGDLSDTRRC